MKLWQELGYDNFLPGGITCGGEWGVCYGSVGGGCALRVGVVWIELRWLEPSPIVYLGKRPNPDTPSHWGNHHFIFFHRTLEPQMQWWVTQTMATEIWALKYPHTCEYGLFCLYDSFRAKLSTSVVALRPQFPKCKGRQYVFLKYTSAVWTRSP